jgi:hypothetical protein
VRYFGNRARVELDPGSLGSWSEEPARSRLEAAVRAAGFVEVELEAFRSGALNVLAGVTSGGD